ncbi:hypothetical protein [Candidatus Uabimicrobium sp. HlEnr_7]|uniref:hypothetical protein n=1 Tax=Candidatus Uabimicrobium helgolandensis TaxID=3095367 RepID=UPI003556640E
MIVEFDFPEEMIPTRIVESASPGKINGNKVVFAPVDISSREKRSYKIRARAISRGNSRLRVRMKSDLLKTNVMEEESTHVY